MLETVDEFGGGHANLVEDVKLLSLVVAEEYEEGGTIEKERERETNNHQNDEEMRVQCSAARRQGGDKGAKRRKVGSVNPYNKSL